MSAIGYLTQEGFAVPDATLRARFGKQLPAFLKKLQVEYQPRVGRPIIVQLYKRILLRGAVHVILPRTLIGTLSGRILDRIEIQLPSPAQVPFVLRAELFPNQIAIVDYLSRQIFTPQRQAAGTATAILNMGAGTGKTFLAAGLIARLGLPTLYIVPRKRLLQQVTKCLRAAIGLAEGASDGEKEPTEGDLAARVINTALGLPAEFFAKYSLIILDEVHMYCSAARREIFRKAVGICVLGMSATTSDRRDGFDVIAHRELAFDGVIDAASVPGFIAEGEVGFEIHAKIIKYNGPPEHTQALTHPATGMLFTPFMNKQFLGDPWRGRIAIREIRALYDWRGPSGQQHCIYVFCEECDPLEILLAELQREFGDGAIGGAIGTYMGSTKLAEIERLSNDARILLTTYSYSGTGISITRMTAIVFLTSRRAGLKQILPRVLRRDGDPSIPRQIVYICDNRTPIRRQLSDHLAAYEHFGAQMEWVKVGWNEI